VNEEKKENEIKTCSFSFIKEKIEEMDNEVSKLRKIVRTSIDPKIAKKYFEESKQRIEAIKQELKDKCSIEGDITY